jgi:hypothetical protein
MLHIPRRFLVNPALTLTSPCESVPPSGGSGDSRRAQTATAVARSVGSVGASIHSENPARDAAGARIDLNTVTTTVVSRHDLADAIAAIHAGLTGPACWHVGRWWTACGAAIERVRTVRSNIDDSLPDRAGP